MNDTGCICGEQEFHTLFYVRKFQIVECDRCRQVRTITPSEFLRTQEYTAADITIYIHKEKVFRSLFQNVLQFIQRYATGGKLVDIGAGVGLLVDEATKRGFDAVGFEPSTVSVKAAKKYFHTTLVPSQFSAKAVSEPVDVVIINHVIEHMPEPQKVILEVTKVLKTSGFLFIGVPNFDSIMRRLKSERWQSIIPDQHRWHFTLKTLDTMFTKLGYKRMGVQGDNHDRSMHPLWKRPIYLLIDMFANLINQPEAILVAYKKIV